LIAGLPTHGQIGGVNSSGGIVPNGPHFIYTPDQDFTGKDSFTYNFKTTNGTAAGQTPALVRISVDAPAPPRAAPFYFIVLAFIIAIVMIVVITIVARRIVRRVRSIDNPAHRSKFSDIIRGYDMDPSLSVFQFLLWTFVLMFAFIGVYLIRIFAGISDPPEGPLPVYLLSIAGISVGTPIISSIISAYRFNEVKFYEEEPTDRTSKVPEQRGRLTPARKVPGFGEMLRQFGKPTLSRFQMFAWTWIGVAIYLAVLFSKVSELSTNVQVLSVPDVDPTLVILMGLSQVAFLGLKTTGSTGLQITQIYPPECKREEFFSIFGKNFGEEWQTVWLGRKRIESTDTEHLPVWTDERIDVKVPIDMDYGIHKVMVVKAGASKLAPEKIKITDKPSQQPTPPPTPPPRPPPIPEPVRSPNA
jgi:hypothetical protein